MIANFTDKLAEQALKRALDNHARVIQRQNELVAEKEALRAEVGRMKGELSECEKQPSLYEVEISVAEIDRLLSERAKKVEALTKSIADGERKLPLLGNAIVKSGHEVDASRDQIKSCRAALAASFERHILQSREVKKALVLLHESRAVWLTSMSGVQGRFDWKGWASGLLVSEELSEKYLTEARTLMRIAND